MMIRCKRITCRPLLPIVFLAACAPMPERPPSLSEQALQVLTVPPGPGEKITTTPEWEIRFSKPVAAETVDSSSVVLSRGEVSPDRYQPASALFKAIDKGELETVPLLYAVTADGMTVDLTVGDQLSAGQSYTLLVTSRVLSAERVPLNQNLASSEEPFIALYQTTSSGASFSSPTTSSTGGGGQNGASSGGGSTTSDGGVSSTSGGGTTDSGSSTPSGGSSDAPSDTPPAAPPPDGRVVLNEIYYDAVGSDTDGLLFVELYGTPAFPVGGYKINFVNGADGKITDSVTLPDGAALRPDGFYLIADSRTDQPTVTQVVGAAGAASVDLIDNFDPQNGPDAVQLLDAAGQLVDAVAYGNGVVPTAENGLATGEGSPAPDVVNGHSIERSSPGLDTDNNAADFVDRPSPTPGR